MELTLGQTVAFDTIYQKERVNENYEEGDETKTILSKRVQKRGNPKLGAIVGVRFLREYELVYEMDGDNNENVLVSSDIIKTIKCYLVSYNMYKKPVYVPVDNAMDAQ